MNPILKITPIGNLGNQMLQLMLAKSIAHQVPGLEIVGHDMPDWNLRAPIPPDFPLNTVILKGQYVDINMIVSLLKRNKLHEIDLSALGFRMEHYLDKDIYQRLFPSRIQPSSVVPDNALLINVRGAEILGNAHPDYGPIPLAFYRQLIETTGLRPVFMGQIGSDDYSLALMRWFPDAQVIPSLGVMNDFDMIRSAKHIVVSVSTFSWLAAWLSDATTIHLPALGILNPLQRPDIQLLPHRDSRYRFYEFPVRLWEGTTGQVNDLTNADLWFPLLNNAEVECRLQQARRSIDRYTARYRAVLAWRVLLRRFLGVGGGIIMKLP